MTAGPVYLLLAQGVKAALALPVTARISEGARGEGVRHVDAAGASSEARESARVGAILAYNLLYREKYVDRRIVVAFEAPRLENLHGRSGDLAFALSLAASWRAPGGAPVFAFPQAAATGVLSPEGAVLPVESLAPKLAAALEVLPHGGFALYPRANEAEVAPALRRNAETRGVVLAPCDRLEDALRRLGARLSGTWLDAPFRGLEPFAFAHAAIFFGRESETQAVLDLLARRPAGRQAVLIEGPSGSGKSSLILAGVLPALLRRGLPERAGARFRWGLLRPARVTPAADPGAEAEALARALQGAWRHADEGAPVLPETALPTVQALDPGAMATWLRAGVAGTEAPTPILVLDQMEGWFDGALQPGTVSRLCDLLAGLAERGVILIGAMTKGRGDRLAAHAALAAVFGVEGRFALDQPLGPARLAAVIHQPARAARLSFEPGLDAEIMAAASHGGPDVLPLLELLLTELFERRDRARHLLRRADYEAVGGLDGVISARADSVHAQASVEEQATIPALLWRLETTGALDPRDFPPGGAAWRLALALRDRRLLVQDEDARGQVRLRPAHEALLRHWSRAVEQRRIDGADAQLWLDLTREAGQWARSERALIPAGPQLVAARALYERRRDGWTPSDEPVLSYIRASLGQSTRRRMLATAGLSAPFFAGAAIGAFALKRSIDYRGRLDFLGVSTPAPDYRTAAAPYLHARGVRLESAFPDSARVVIVNNIGVYGGSAAKGENFLTEIADGWKLPLSFTLGFARPPKLIELTRAPLWAATASGVTHPAWLAQAFDAEGQELARAAEALIRSHTSVPPRRFRLDAGQGRIARLKITSDDRLHGKPFAGVQAALIQNLRLAL